MSNFENLVGKQFTYLTVLSRDTNPKYNRVMWKCACKCGNIITVAGNDLKRKYGATKSCGCRKHESQNVKHGMRHTRIYAIWSGICRRCYNPNVKEYKNYGGRGITVCDEWRHDFAAFYKWASENGYTDTLTIERIDNNGNYSPDNCKWVTLSDQANNRRNTLYLEHEGQTKSLKDWSEQFGVDRKLAYQRYWRSIHKGRSISFDELFKR